MLTLPPLVASRQRHGWPVVLDCGPLRLRPLHRRDRFAWWDVRQRNREWLTPWDATSPQGGSPYADFAGMVRAGQRQAKALQGMPWALEWRGDGGKRFIGQVSVFGLTWGSARGAQIGYWIDREFAGRGLMPVAVAMACDYLFDVAKLHRVEIAIRPENAASLRIVQKLGLREEGLRRSYLHIDGEWRDHRIFAVTAPEVPEGLLCRCPTPRW